MHALPPHDETALNQPHDAAPDALVRRATADVTADRRRPGRIEDVHAELVPLLREPGGTAPVAADTMASEAADDSAEDAVAAPSGDVEMIEALAGGRRNELGFARGIAVALLLVLPFWCAVLWTVAFR